MDDTEHTLYINMDDTEHTLYINMDDTEHTLYINRFRCFETFLNMDKI
jgi:hypothetical protein